MKIRKELLALIPELPPNEWRVVEGVVQRRTEWEIAGIYESFTLEELAKKISLVDLIDVEPEIELDKIPGSYGDDDSAHLVVRGWEVAQEFILREALESIQRRNHFTEQQKQAQIAALRASDPDLFR